MDKIVSFLLSNGYVFAVSSLSLQQASCGIADVEHRYASAFVLSLGLARLTLKQLYTAL